MLARSLARSTGMTRLAAAPARRQLPYFAAAQQMHYGGDPYESAARAGGGHGDYRAWRGTTVLCLQRDGKAVMIADGQVSMGDVVFKSNVQKVRRFGSTPEKEGQIVAGFAGGTADALTLFERLEARLEEFPGQLTRAATSLARDWRTDKYLRRLEATMVVTDGENAYLISGGGDVMNAEGGVIGIGSGGFYATAAARALVTVEDLDIEEVAKRSMTVAADLCVYTNHNFTTLVTHAATKDAEEGEIEAAEEADADADAEKKE